MQPRARNQNRSLLSACSSLEQCQRAQAQADDASTRYVERGAPQRPSHGDRAYPRRRLSRPWSAWPDLSRSPAADRHVCATLLVLLIASASESLLARGLAAAKWASGRSAPAAASRCATGRSDCARARRRTAGLPGGDGDAARNPGDSGPNPAGRSRYRLEPAGRALRGRHHARHGRAIWVDSGAFGRAHRHGRRHESAIRAVGRWARALALPQRARRAADLTVARIARARGPVHEEPHQRPDRLRLDLDSRVHPA